MFGKNDFLKLTIMFLDENEKVISTSKLVGKSIKVPENTKMASLIEQTNDNMEVINNYYIGQTSNFKDLLETSKYSIDLSNIKPGDLRNNEPEEINVVYEIKNNKVIVSRIIKKEERVFSSPLLLSYHLHKLSNRLELFYKESNEVKTLIYK